MSTGIPSGFHTVQPFLMVPDIDAFAELLVRGFEGTLIERVVGEDGQVLHGEVRVGDSIVMLGRACSTERAPTQAMLYLYVADADATYARALAAGAVSHEAPADQFYGDRVGAVTDAVGNVWWIATRKETLDEAEIARRLAARRGGD